MTAIVIPTYSNLRFLQRTVETLLDYTEGVEFRVIVIDNGSRDGTAAYLNNKRVEVIRNEVNLGFIKAVNQGMNARMESEHILLLNDDVQITDPLWLARLESNLTDPQVGAVGAVSNYAAGLQDIQESYRLPLIHETRTLIGAFMLIRGEAAQKVGLLDERYGDNMFEDFDYCFRLTDAGYKLLVDRRVFILHYGSRTLMRDGQDRFNARLVRGEELLKTKWGEERWQNAQIIPESLQRWAAELGRSFQSD